MTGFVAAAQFLTRIPIRNTAAPVSRSAMAPWFPVVGALVGAVVGGTAAALQYWLAPTAAAAVAVAIGMLVTGAFHEDGLADVADAIAGGGTPARRNEILDDPRHGTYGVAALGASIVVRVAALANLAAVGPAAALAGAVAAHALARSLAIGVIGFAPASAPGGLGASFRSDVASRRAATTVLIGAALAGVATGWWAGPSLGVALALVGALAYVAVRAFGGANGDVAGAAEQVAEAAAMLVASALAARHGVWWR